MKLPVTKARSVSRSELYELTEFAGQLADAAGAAILPYFRSSVEIDHKPGRGDFDPVTVADIAAETVMRELITQTYPEHGIFGEEFGSFTGTSGLTWVLDPIDGTRAFISGIPLWGTLIALHNGEQSVIGVADQPYLQERFIGNSLQATLYTRSGETRLHTRQCDKLSQATLMATSPDIFDTAHEKDKFESVAAAAKMTRYGGDCYAYCMLASGFVDVVVEAGLQPYDIQALVPIIENAGGYVTDWSGGNDLASGRVVAAGCQALLQEVIALTGQSPGD